MLSYVSVMMDAAFRKGACYRYDDNIASCFVFGDSWDQVYDKLLSLLKVRGYIDERNLDDLVIE